MKGELTMKKLGLVLLVLLGIPLIVSAHVYMRECIPEEDAIVTTAPEKVTMIFVGSVEPVFSKIEVFDQKGSKVSKKTTFLEDDTVMEAKLAGDLQRGEYTVKWLCMGLDGHKQKGSYKFTLQ